MAAWSEGNKVIFYDTQNKINAAANWYSAGVYLNVDNVKLTMSMSLDEPAHQARFTDTEKSNDNVNPPLMAPTSGTVSPLPAILSLDGFIDANEVGANQMTVRDMMRFSGYGDKIFVCDGVYCPNKPAEGDTDYWQLFYMTSLELSRATDTEDSAGTIKKGYIINYSCELHNTSLYDV